MSWLNNFSYEEGKPVFECAEGINLMCIKKVEETTTKNGERMLVVTCNVKNSNGEQLKHYLVEGQYFDKSLSRLMDCFGIKYTETNPQNWVNHVGSAQFDHYKYNPQTKKKEIVADMQCHLLKKEGFEQPEITPETPAQPPMNDEEIPF